ncbi:MAG: hypothetical protein L6Q99_02850 [Planctomycetes bacterium]|nr:hypothetical protein [Planctomycetota bacterium]
MTHQSALLIRSGSTLGERVAASVRGECVLLDTASPRVHVAGGAVTWNGVRLDRLGACIVETPFCPWPQPVAEPRAGEPAPEMQRRGMAARERTALHVAALRLAAKRVRFANDPTRAAELAMAPALALERLANAGVPVRPWRIGRTAAQSGCRVGLNAPRGLELASSATCLDVEVGPRGVATHFALGGEWLAATADHAELAPLARSVRLADGAPAAERELVVRALAALGLEFGAVHVADGAIAFVEAGVDLDLWDAATDGRVATALANWLVRVPQTSS